MRALRNTVFEVITLRARPLGLCAAALAALACGSADADSLQRASGASSAAPGSGDDVAPNAGASNDTGLVADPPLLGGACTGQVAQDTFAAALCSALVGR